MDWVWSKCGRFVWGIVMKPRVERIVIELESVLYERRCWLRWKGDILTIFNHVIDKRRREKSKVCVIDKETKDRKKEIVLDWEGNNSGEFEENECDGLIKDIDVRTQEIEIVLEVSEENKISWKLEMC